jgi:predicted nucleotide-binding protein
MTLENIKAKLSSHSHKVTKEERTGNDDGWKLSLDIGAIVNVFDTGKFSVQGKNADEIKALLAESGMTDVKIINKKVFVVYGHDPNARTQLEAMLRRWDLEPLILDQLASSGQTIIEKLEEYIEQACFGIVLATPDDLGYAKAQPDDIKHRVRQNVVLELGMLLAKMGRSKVAILLSQAEVMERPSDIDGLIYIPFKDNVEETKLSLAKEMEKCGYKFTATQL